MIDHTLAQLRDLKLQGMAHALQRQLEQPASTELGFEQRLALLVQHECDSRHARRCARLLQQARLKYPQAAIEDFDARPGRGIERDRLRQDLAGLRAGAIRLPPGTQRALSAHPAPGRRTAYAARGRLLHQVAGPTGKG